MSITKAAQETYDNGSSTIGPYRRVIKDGGVLRVASSVELENGTTDATVLPNQPARVNTTDAQGKYQYVSAVGITEGDTIYRADNGLVSNVGTSQLGTADEDALAGGVFFVNVAVGGSGGGAGADRNDGEETITFSPTNSVTFDGGTKDRKRVVLTDDWTPTFNATASREYTLKIVQDATGGRTITWPNNMLWSGAAPQPVAVPNEPSIFKFEYDPGTGNFLGRSA